MANYKAGAIASGSLFVFFLFVLLGAVLAFQNAWTSLPAVITMSTAGSASFICLILLIVFIILFVKSRPRNAATYTGSGSSGSYATGLSANVATNSAANAAATTNVSGSPAVDQAVDQAVNETENQAQQTLAGMAWTQIQEVMATLLKTAQGAINPAAGLYTAAPSTDPQVTAALSTLTPQITNTIATLPTQNQRSSYVLALYNKFLSYFKQKTTTALPASVQNAVNAVTPALKSAAAAPPSAATLSQVTGTAPSDPKAAYVVVTNDLVFENTLGTVSPTSQAAAAAAAIPALNTLATSVSVEAQKLPPADKPTFLAAVQEAVQDLWNWG